MERPLLFRVAPDGGIDEFARRYESAVAAGFDGIELDLTMESGALDAVVIPAGAKVGVVSARCTDTDIETSLAEVDALLQRAASLGARCLTLMIPPVHGDAPARSVDGFDRYQDGLNFAYALLHHARHEAERGGVTVALEAGAGGCLLSPVELREIVDAANSWAVGACIDTHRIARIGSPGDWLTTLRHRVHAIRMGGKDSDSALAAALEEIQFTGPLIAGGSGNPADEIARLARFAARRAGA